MQSFHQKSRKNNGKYVRIELKYEKRSRENTWKINLKSNEKLF